MSTTGKKFPNRKSPAPYKHAPSHRANGMSKIQIQVGLDPVMLDAVEARSARCGETRVEYIRRLIEADLRECGAAA